MADIETAKAAAIDQRARRAAKRAGLIAVRSRWRRDSVDNRGGFQILDPYRNAIVGGARFDMSAEEVIAFCAEDEKATS
jgi:hypothetical protein